MKYYKYYSLRRPVGLGTCPKGGMVEFRNYDTRKYVGEIGLYAWADISYNRPLMQYEVDAYELAPSIQNEVDTDVQA